MSNENKIYTLGQIIDQAKKYDYKLAECLDQQGQKACTAQAMNIKPWTWVNKTLLPFTQRPANNGIYYVYMYPDTRRKGKPDIFPIQVGKPSQNANNSHINPPQVIVNHNLGESKEDRLSLEKFMEYQKEISDLRAENTRLTLELAQAKKEIAEYEEAEPDENLSEGGAKGFFADLLPVADQWLQNQKEQRYFEMVRNANGNPHLLAQADRFMPMHMRQAQPGQAWNGLTKPGAQAQTNLANDPTIKKAQEFIDQLDENDYAKVEAVKKTSPTLTDLFDNLAIAHPDLYENLYNFCNPNS